MTNFVPTNQEIGEYDTKQAIQHLQGGAGSGVLRLAKRLRRLPAGILHEARGEVRDRANRSTSRLFHLSPCTHSIFFTHRQTVTWGMSVRFSIYVLVRPILRR